MLQCEDGKLVVEGLRPSVWIPMLPLAEDVEAENIRLSFQTDGGSCSSQRLTNDRIQVTLTKDLKAGETPKLWFSSEVASQLDLPFLNFSHIVGKIP